MARHRGCRPLIAAIHKLNGITTCFLQLAILCRHASSARAARAMQAARFLAPGPAVHKVAIIFLLLALALYPG